MTAKFFAFAIIALGVAICPAAKAKDRAFDHDWRTGVTVGPGAMTWTDNQAQKEALIKETAAARGKTCSHYAFLAWPPGSGGTLVLMDATRKNYEAAGYTVVQQPGGIPTETIWTVGKEEREAVILWDAVSGSTIYLSCLTAGEPAPSGEKFLYVGILSTLGLAALIGGLWLIRRVRALGATSMSWPSVPGVMKSSSVEAYRAPGGSQYIAKVAYDYTVDGSAYHGDVLRFGNHAGALAAAEADAAKYQAGMPVEVRYDPAKPHTATLETGQSGWSLWGLVLTIIGAGMIVLAIGIHIVG
ncbi:MAG TPA: DUF3592 domain-containing protein [Hyphomicrobium sp.]|jgi:hypothetical protein